MYKKKQATHHNTQKMTCVCKPPSNPPREHTPHTHTHTRTQKKGGQHHDETISSCSCGLCYFGMLCRCQHCEGKDSEGGKRDMLCVERRRLVYIVQSAVPFS